MPVLINNLKSQGYFKIRIDLSEAFDSEDEDQAPYAKAWDGAYIELRELNAPEQARVQEAQAEGMQGALTEVLRDAIVDHNLYREEGKKASSDEVAEILKTSGTIFTHVLSEWVQHLPLAKRSGGRSAR